MPIQFQIDERIMGYAASTAHPGEKVRIRYRELIGPGDATHLLRQLENIHGSIFNKIPSLPSPSVIDHLLVVIRPDLSCSAYVNELDITAHVKTNRAMKAGSLVYTEDISDISSVDIGVDVPSDCGVVFVRSTGWKRSLFFDFGPLLPEAEPRQYPLKKAWAQQALLLLGLPPIVSEDLAQTETKATPLGFMEHGLTSLNQLLRDRCQEESAYQELLAKHSWMFGGKYSKVCRHQAFDDQRIPDFTAVRCYDSCHDIIELKQPFLKLFRKDGGHTSAFNDAWNQAEQYLSFATQQRSYLRDEKSLFFESPTCVLLLGYHLTDRDLREIRNREGLRRTVSVFTYDHLIKSASHMVSLMRTAHEFPIPSFSEGVVDPEN